MGRQVNWRRLLRKKRSKRIKIVTTINPLMLPSISLNSTSPNNRKGIPIITKNHKIITRANYWQPPQFILTIKNQDPSLNPSPSPNQFQSQNSILTVPLKTNNLTNPSIRNYFPKPKKSNSAQNQNPNQNRNQD